MRIPLNESLCLRDIVTGQHGTRVTSIAKSQHRKRYLIRFTTSPKDLVFLIDNLPIALIMVDNI